MKATSNQKKLIKIITMPIRVLNKGKDLYVNSMMDVAQKPRYGSSNMRRSVKKGQAVSDPGLSKSLSTSVTTSRSSSYRNEDLRDFVRAYSTSNMGLDIDFYLEQLIKQEQMKKLKELMERNNFSKSKSLRGVSKSYRNVAMGKIDEEEEGEELSTSNGVKKAEGLYLRSPIYFELVMYDGTLPTLVLNPNAWTKIASIIFLDLPVGTGFSYGRTPFASGSNDSQACAQAVQFLRKWLVSHPEFLSNPFYVAGDSYAGIFVPIVTQMISNGNEAGFEPSINLKGYLAGNPLTFPAESNFSIPFSHGMGLISDELYESLRRSCGFDDLKSDSDSAECSRGLEAFEQCTNGINKYQILEKNCPKDAPQLRRSLSDEKRTLTDKFGRTTLSALSVSDCRTMFSVCSPFSTKRRPHDSAQTIIMEVDARWLFGYWLNDEKVQNALHIRKGTIGTWVRCNRDSLDFKIIIRDVRPYHADLSAKGYRSLIYSGDHDFLVPFQSTQAWIRDLNYSIIDDWRPWIVEGQYAGYTRAYSNKMTFATVKGGGHTAPEYRPPQCYAMFERWISKKPL